MRKIVGKKAYAVMLGTMLALGSLLFSGLNNVAKADSSEEEKEVFTLEKGRLYEFDKKNDYEFSNSIVYGDINSEGTSYGKFSLSGKCEDKVKDIKFTGISLANFLTISEGGNFPTYFVSSGTMEFSYEVNRNYLFESDTERYACTDNGKNVNGEKLESKIESGAILIQTSLDGVSWVTDAVKTDIASPENGFSNPFYKSKEIQQVNGCFFRIIVVYKTNQKTGKSGLFNKGDNYKRYAEVYEFYIVNAEKEDVTTIDSDVKTVLGEVVPKKRDSGYSIDLNMDVKDPHYGWNLGYFYVNGYSDTAKKKDDQEITVFLKNVGDNVTLWFHLDEDINCLNGNPNLSIAEDKKGYDKKVALLPQNFKRGAMIIRHKNYRNEWGEPTVYTDFLAANTKTGADTRVQLFEEGDYEVSLDYSIKDSKGLDSYTDYQISFAFSVRNANNMIFPFDSLTRDELNDYSMTENGFYLDLAKSRYLKIEVKKDILTVDESGCGTKKSDTRGYRVVKDGEKFEEEGIYTFMVYNEYVEDPTLKTIIVAKENRWYKALAKVLPDHDLDYINEKVRNGAEIKSNGDIVEKHKPTEFPTETFRETESDSSTDIPSAAVTDTTQSSAQPMIYPIVEVTNPVVINLPESTATSLFDQSNLLKNMDVDRIVVAVITIIILTLIAMWLIVTGLFLVNGKGKRIAIALERRNQILSCQINEKKADNVESFTIREGAEESEEADENT